MLSAFLAGDGRYDGVFLTGVTSTGIFCRPSCPARKPRPEHVTFFATVQAAEAAGFRACLRCRPGEVAGAPPAWLKPLLDEVSRQPERRWEDTSLRECGFDPVRVRRWFSTHHGVTFQEWQRRRRAGAAVTRLGQGADLLATGLDFGWQSASGFADAVARLTGTSPGKARDSRVALVERIASPLGVLLAAATDTGLCLLEFTDEARLQQQLPRLAARLKLVLAPGRNAHIDQTEGQLSRYFAGELRSFSVPLDIAGTPFQEQVWSALCRIPYGSAWSYAQLAGDLGRPTAHRAVAGANGSNRLAIVIPCHRVVASDGTLAGYGGGRWRKQRLLELEGAVLRR